MRAKKGSAKKDVNIHSHSSHFSSLATLFSNKNKSEVPEINLSESSDDDVEEETHPMFAHISKSESYFDEKGDLHLIYFLKRDEYSKDTLLEISAGVQGILGSKVSSKEPPKITIPPTENTESERTARVWESPTKILKESFGNMNLSFNSKGELEKQVFENPGPSTSGFQFPKKMVSLSCNSNRENSDVGNTSKKNKVLESSSKKENFKTPSSKKGKNNHIKRDGYEYVLDPNTLRTEKPSTSNANKKPNNDNISKTPTIKVESKSKKFKRISALSSSSEDEISVLKIESPHKNTKTFISSSDSDSDEKKPITRQVNKKTRSSRVFKAENFSQEDIIDQVYRFEGIYWEYNKKKHDLFNCFECSKNLMSGSVIEHFTRRHSALIAG
ncbi:hypothetical protein ACFFRR_007026 [Megaselia abdita]